MNLKRLLSNIQHFGIKINEADISWAIQLEPDFFSFLDTTLHNRRRLQPQNNTAGSNRPDQIESDIKLVKHSIRVIDQESKRLDEKLANLLKIESILDKQLHAQYADVNESSIIFDASVKASLNETSNSITTRARYQHERVEEFCAAEDELCERIAEILGMDESYSLDENVKLEMIRLRDIYHDLEVQLLELKISEASLSLNESEGDEPASPDASYLIEELESLQKEALEFISSTADSQIIAPILKADSEAYAKTLKSRLSRTTECVGNLQRQIVRVQMLYIAIEAQWRLDTIRNVDVEEFRDCVGVWTREYLDKLEEATLNAYIPGVVDPNDQLMHDVKHALDGKYKRGLADSNGLVISFESIVRSAEELAGRYHHAVQSRETLEFQIRSGSCVDMNNFERSLFGKMKDNSETCNRILLAPLELYNLEARIRELTSSLQPKMKEAVEKQNKIAAIVQE